ncbi:MAG: hypothetical protein ACLTR6_10330 [Clostridium fessum]
MIAGCIGTSNVLAGQMFDVPVKGTHAHSWIMSFPDELTAFRAYARALSELPASCLVDTYDTQVRCTKRHQAYSRRCSEAGIPLGPSTEIRLDSGDLGLPF